MSTYSRVRIAFFKPMGFEDTYFVRTENRGKAVLTVISKYEENMLRYLNYVDVSLVDERNVSPGTMICDLDRRVTELEKESKE